MALIKCSECGHNVSDRAEMCPNCGCPIEKKIYCEECGQELSMNDRKCPNCGCPTKDNNEKAQHLTNTVEEKQIDEEYKQHLLNKASSYRKGGWTVMILVLICIIFDAIFLQSGFLLNIPFYILMFVGVYFVSKAKNIEEKVKFKRY